MVLPAPRIHRSHTSDEREHVQLLLQVARLYYEQGATQAQIAKKVGYSRPTVSRLLTEAREQGVVHIRINHPLERAMSMEAELAEKFGLHDARIAESSDLAGLTQKIARCAADYLVETSYEDSVITVSNGFAVNATIEAMPQMNWAQTRVVQAIGSVNDSEVMVDSSETCRRLASRLGGRHYALPAPLLVDSPEVATSLTHSRQVASILELGTRADFALVGIGTIDRGREGHVFNGLTDAAVSEVLDREGAVGHVCGHHFNAAGEHVRTPLCNRTIGITLEQLRELPRVIGVSWGEQKVPAIRAALLGGFVSALVTDRTTAQALLDS